MASSLRSKVWRSILRRMFSAPGLSTLEERSRSLGKGMFHGPFPKSLRVERHDVGGLTCAMIRPARSDRKRVILHLHGGGFVSGSIATYLMMCVPMARALNMAVFLPEYRLAPEYPYPAALDDALKAYRWLLAQGYDPNDIAISGDSAGGGLCLATIMALRDAGEPLPAAALCVSPWADLTHEGESHVANARSEVILKTELLKSWAALYAGDIALDDPRISPVNGDFRGFPPLLIQVDREEILLDDSRRIEEKAKAAGIDVTLRLWDGLWHVWPALGDLIPESREAFEEMGRFIDARRAG